MTDNQLVPDSATRKFVPDVEDDDKAAHHRQEQKKPLESGFRSLEYPCVPFQREGQQYKCRKRGHSEAEYSAPKHSVVVCM